MRTLRARRSVDSTGARLQLQPSGPAALSPWQRACVRPPGPPAPVQGKHKWVEEGALRTRIQTLGRPFSRVLCGAGCGSLGQMHMCFAVVPKSSSPLSFTNPSITAYARFSALHGGVQRAFKAECTFHTESLISATCEVRCSVLKGGSGGHVLTGVSSRLH